MPKLNLIRLILNFAKEMKVRPLKIDGKVYIVVWKRGEPRQVGFVSECVTDVFLIRLCVVRKGKWLPLHELMSY